MTQEQITEGNKLIAEFMGFTHWIDSGEWIGYCKLDVDKYSAYKDGMGHRPHACLFEDLRFHSSYDWLMPVIDKIRSMNEYSGFVDHTSSIVDEGGVYINTKFIENTWKDVVEFIKWHNANMNSLSSLVMH